MHTVTHTHSQSGTCTDPLSKHCVYSIFIVCHLFWFVVHSHLLRSSLSTSPPSPPCPVSSKIQATNMKKKSPAGKLAVSLANLALGWHCSTKSQHFCLTHLAKISFALSRSLPPNPSESGLYIFCLYFTCASPIVYLMCINSLIVGCLDSKRGINCSDCARFVACDTPFIIYQMRHHMSMLRLRNYARSPSTFRMPRPPLWKCFQLEQVIHFVATSKVSTNENFKNAYSLRTA